MTQQKKLRARVGKNKQEKHVLVVDNEEYALLTMEFILEVANFRVTLAKNGQDAWKAIVNSMNGNDRIDLVITDLQMPGLSGLDLIDRINASHFKIPVLVITGYGSQKIYRELNRKGCHEVLDKPIEEKELIHRVHKLVGV